MIVSMRKVLIIALTALVLVGCNDTKLAEVSCKIGFTSQLLRSFVENVSDLQKEEMKIYASYTLDGRTARVFDAERLYYDNTIQGWDYTSTQYWMRGALYHFFAVCPYSTPSTFSDGMASVSIANYESSTDGDDLLYATAIRNLAVKEDYSAVQLHFNHACAALQFNLVNASNSVLVDVRNIRLVGLYNKGTFHFDYEGTSSWTLEGLPLSANATLQPFEGVCTLPEGGLPVNIDVEHSLYDNGAILVLPQNIYKSSVTLHLEYKKQGDAEYTVHNIQLGMLGGSTPTEWKSGEKYKYNFNITDNTITTEVRVIPWVDNYVDL